MRIVTLGVSALMLSACAHAIVDGGDLRLDEESRVSFAISRSDGTGLYGGGGSLTSTPDLARMAGALGVTRETMVEWGMQCRIDVQWHLADCQLLGITPAFAGVSARIAPFMNGLSISRIDADVTPDQLVFRGRFHLRNAVPAPDWNAPCYAGGLCPVIHTLERNPPPPPPPPPPSVTPPGGR